MNQEEQTTTCIMEKHFIGVDDVKIRLNFQSKNGIITTAEYQLIENGVTTKKQLLKPYENEKLEECKKFLIENCGCHEAKSENQ